MMIALPGLLYWFVDTVVTLQDFCKWLQVVLVQYPLFSNEAYPRSTRSASEQSLSPRYLISS